MKPSDHLRPVDILDVAIDFLEDFSSPLVRRAARPVCDFRAIGHSRLFADLGPLGTPDALGVDHEAIHIEDCTLDHAYTSCAKNQR